MSDAIKIPPRFITATSLFDGHDASINVMRRILQREGAEVIHLGHNRPVHEIVDAAIQEDVQGIAVSSYQGGHVEFFKYMVDLLAEADAAHVRVFAGGGGTIIPSEIAELEAYGVEKIYAPGDGQQMGLVGMIRHMLEHTGAPPEIDWERELGRVPQRHPQALARCLTFLELADAGQVNEEAAQYFSSQLERMGTSRTASGQGRTASKQGRAAPGLGNAASSRGHAVSMPVPVLGITGTGGAGKSSLTDELIRRFLEEFPEKTVAILSVDPTHRRSGGALLGDRIRMNAISTPRVFMRSIATRRDNFSLSTSMEKSVGLCRAAGFDLVVVETAGIGQSDTEICDLADFSVYVMTPEFGAASQLEKIGMLDFADMIAINKFEKRGSEDALRDVKKQVRRNRGAFDGTDGELPVYGTIASRFQDAATDRFYDALMERMGEACKLDWRNGGAAALSKKAQLPAGEAQSSAKETQSFAKETKPPAGEAQSSAKGTKPPAGEAQSPGKKAQSSAKETQSFAKETKPPAGEGKPPSGEDKPPAGEDREAAPAAIIPPERVRYLSEVAETLRGYEASVEAQAAAASRAYALHGALTALDFPAPEGPRPIADSAVQQAVQQAGLPGGPERPAASAPAEDTAERPEDTAARPLAELYNQALAALSPEAMEKLAGFEALKAAYRAENFSYTVRGRVIEVPNYEQTLSHLKLPKVVLPRLSDWGDQLRWLMLENVPGSFPFTAGLFPFKRAEEEPTRMFAGEGPPERTNRRFHFISAGQPAKRLSTAFDSVTLYGNDPHERPDIYGKVGNSGVSICTLDDLKRLYSGFDLCQPNTSVSMTINGPAPVLLAFFLNAAIDQQVERYLSAEGKWEQAEKRMGQWFAERGAARPVYRGELPEGHDGLGLRLLGLGGDALLEPETYGKIREHTLSVVRGTVQADILKEDQAQNTCIFSTEFALTMMGDIQAYFVEHDMPNFYSVSVSGYHMAEAGANPITQIAFTLANGFTFVEHYLARGLPIDKFARNLSFFFSNGMEPEYAVIGRVARRIWAVALRDKYGAGERAQKLKYHIQTSGRSLHAQEIGFNDIRTTLQALYAVYDNCNSLHTNAYDEAITTPTEESVRRAIAIQLIINRELGLAKVMNPTQGSYIIEELTQLVQEAILAEFDRLTERGGVLGAMETMYQRGKIQDESLHYEEMKHSGEYPIIGVNTFLSGEAEQELSGERLTRSTEEEKQAQIAGLAEFQATHAAASPAALEALKGTARRRGNIFTALMECVKTCSLGQISTALYEVGGQYRRNM